MTILSSVMLFSTLLACSGGSDAAKIEVPVKPVTPDPEPSSKVIVAYVTSWSTIMPDPTKMTHINYAFGHVSESFDGVGIAEESRLRSIVKHVAASGTPTKVMLSIGGWGSGRFSEMAGDKKRRESFAADCARVIKEYSLAGVDIDWEFPTQTAGGLISSSPNDKDNYTLLMRDIRAAIGADKLLTLATVVSGDYINLKYILPYIDFVNIMAYDMAMAPSHQAPLFRSPIAGWITADEGVQKHIDAGVPANKLTLGLPFYGHGSDKFMHTVNFREIGDMSGYTYVWDDVAKVPYYADKSGKLVFGFDNAQSMAAKCQYILDKGLLGGMYWDYDGDDAAGTMRNAVFNGLNPKK